jgi:hypothetical protein
VVKTKNDVLQGTLALMVLKTLAREPMHGYGITVHIQAVSKNLLRVEEGSLYPALHRMEQEGWIGAEWGTFGEQSSRPLLSADTSGPQAACGRGKELGADHVCRRLRSAVHVRGVPCVVVYSPAEHTATKPIGTGSGRRIAIAHRDARCE